MQLQALLEALSEQQFAAKMRKKNSAVVIYGQGSFVDKQNEKAAIQAMTAVIQEKFPNYPFQFYSVGRFGLNQRQQSWEFDGTMTTLGHPSSWISASRGYYAELAKTIILFPKDDDGFKPLISDLAQAIGKPIKQT